MRKLTVYLDNCCFNRPFDNQTHSRIYLETLAKLDIQQNIRDRKLNLAWSYILEYENTQNPFIDRREAILLWKKIAVKHIVESPEIIECAEEYLEAGLKPKDALHIACAIEAKADFFITTDDIILKKLVCFSDKLKVVSPLVFVAK